MPTSTAHSESKYNIGVWGIGESQGTFTPADSNARPHSFNGQPEGDRALKQIVARRTSTPAGYPLNEPEADRALRLMPAYT